VGGGGSNGVELPVRMPTVVMIVTHRFLSGPTEKLGWTGEPRLAREAPGADLVLPPRLSLQQMRRRADETFERLLGQDVEAGDVVERLQIRVMLLEVVADVEHIVGGDHDAGDILFGQSSRVTGDYDLTLDTTGQAEGNGSIQGNDIDVDQLTLVGVKIAKLFGTICSDDAIDLSGVSAVVLSDTVTLKTMT